MFVKNFPFIFKSTSYLEISLDPATRKIFTKFYNMVCRCSNFLITVCLIYIIQLTLLKMGWSARTDGLRAPQMSLKHFIYLSYHKKFEIYKTAWQKVLCYVEQSESKVLNL